jgi:uncharacterized surface anchored protein
MAQTGRVRIVVVDPLKALIPQATIELLDKEGKLVRNQRTDERGASLWLNLPIGDSRFRVLSPGFNAKPIVVTITNSDELRVEVTLEPGVQGGVIRVEIPPV